jgi:hypothetical protein
LVVDHNPDLHGVHCIITCVTTSTSCPLCSAPGSGVLVLQEHRIFIGNVNSGLTTISFAVAAPVHSVLVARLVHVFIDELVQLICIWINIMWTPGFSSLASLGLLHIELFVNFGRHHLSICQVPHFCSGRLLVFLQSQQLAIQVHPAVHPAIGIDLDCCGTLSTEGSGRRRQECVRSVRTERSNAFAKHFMFFQLKQMCLSFGVFHRQVESVVSKQAMFHLHRRCRS